MHNKENILWDFYHKEHIDYEELINRNSVPHILAFVSNPASGVEQVIEKLSKRYGFAVIETKSVLEEYQQLVLPEVHKKLNEDMKLAIKSAITACRLRKNAKDNTILMKCALLKNFQTNIFKRLWVIDRIYHKEELDLLQEAKNIEFVIINSEDKLREQVFNLFKTSQTVAVDLKFRDYLDNSYDFVSAVGARQPMKKVEGFDDGVKATLKQFIDDYGDYQTNITKITTELINKNKIEPKTVSTFRELEEDIITKKIEAVH
jgi:hypothetical protein